MIHISDGPAGPASLALRRAPMYLRVTIGAAAGKTDALDLVDDQPEPHETIHVYRRREGTWGAVCVRPGGRFEMGVYEWVADAPAEDLRETAAWRAWATAQPAIPT